MNIELVPLLGMYSSMKSEWLPYLQGASFAAMSELSDAALTELVLLHTEDLRAGKYSREEACALWGGFVLRIDGADSYFPQCCGELSDIQFWRNTAQGIDSFREGHPVPLVTLTGDKIHFDFCVKENEEPFDPPPSELLLTIDKAALVHALPEAEAALQLLEKRLEKINTENNLQLENIGSLLIWHNGNYA